MFHPRTFAEEDGDEPGPADSEDEGEREGHAGEVRGDAGERHDDGPEPVRTPIGSLPAPLNLIVSHGIISGELDAKVNPVFGASSYNWTCTAAAAGAVPQTGQSTAASFAFTGLTPGVSYTITANAVGARRPRQLEQPGQ